MATLLLLVIYLAFISLGLPDSMLGAAWPLMRNELGLPFTRQTMQLFPNLHHLPYS